MPNATAGTCLASKDCPREMFCYYLTRDRGETGVCMCNAWRGKAGAPECESFNAAGLVQLIWTSGLAFVAFVTLCTALRDIYITRRELGGLTSTAANRTLGHVTVALACFTAWQLFYVGELNYTGERPLDEKGEKINPNRVGSTWTILIMQIVSMWAMLNISVMWLEMSQNIKAMSPQICSGISRYKRACRVTGIIFTTAFLTVALTGMLQFASMLTMPFILGVSVVFILGRRGMVKVLSSTAGSNLGSREVTNRLQRSMRNIKRCSRNVILAVMAVVSSSVLFLLVGRIGPNDWIVVPGPGGYWCIGALVSKLQPTSTLLLLRTIAGYCHESVASRTGRPTAYSVSPTSSTGPLRAGSVTTTTTTSAQP